MPSNNVKSENKKGKPKPFKKKLDKELKETCIELIASGDYKLRKNNSKEFNDKSIDKLHNDLYAKVLSFHADDTIEKEHYLEKFEKTNEILSRYTIQKYIREYEASISNPNKNSTEERYKATATTIKNLLETAEVTIAAYKISAKEWSKIETNKIYIDERVLNKMYVTINGCSETDILYIGQLILQLYTPHEIFIEKGFNGFIVNVLQSKVVTKKTSNKIIMDIYALFLK